MSNISFFHTLEFFRTSISSLYHQGDEIQFNKFKKRVLKKTVGEHDYLTSGLSFARAKGLRSYF